MSRPATQGIVANFNLKKLILRSGLKIEQVCRPNNISDSQR